MTTRLAIGTAKGAFFLTSEDRRDWTLEEPAFPGWKVTAFARTPGGDYLLATASNWFGAALHRSTDATSWTQIVDGPAWPASRERPLTQIWTLTTAGRQIYAGVDEAGLFSSNDDGHTWQPIDALNEHPSRRHWEPGLGGLCAHRVIVDPTNASRVWVGISAVGVFRTDDGGSSWQAKNGGVEPASPDGESEEAGWCVHSLVIDPDRPDHLWRQEHRGVFRSRDGGDSWERIETGLPASFGFPIVRDHSIGRLFIVPLTSDEFRLPVDGILRVYRSDDDGDTWAASGTGLPEATFTTVLRGAMDADQAGGVYFGTTGGAVYATVDGGDGWTRLPGTFPRITSVRVFADA
jgi:photosystem II stability/assembly factor-like uncharacterized protein